VWSFALGGTRLRARPETCDSLDWDQYFVASDDHAAIETLVAESFAASRAENPEELPGPAFDSEAITFEPSLCFCICGGTPLLPFTTNYCFDSNSM
jgi:hypothetical protein